MEPITAITLGLLLTHELDAMTAREWRLLPGLSRLSDARGRVVFVALHAPLHAALFVGLSGPNAAQWATGLAAFCVLHTLAHILLHRHPDNGFRRLDAWLWIGGAGVSGAVELVMRGL